MTKPAASAGRLRLYRERGVETCVICLTPGQAATYRGGARNDQELAALRRKEFAAACEILKVSRGIVLDYPDGQLHRLDMQRVVSDLTLRIREFRPQVLLTFDPAGGVTGHTDHTMASIFATLAFHWAGRSNRFPDQLDRLGRASPRSEAVPHQLPTSLSRDASRSPCLRQPRSSRSATIWKPRLRRSARTPASSRCGRCLKSTRGSAAGENCFTWRPP